MPKPYEARELLSCTIIVSVLRATSLRKRISLTTLTCSWSEERRSPAAATGRTGADMSCRCRALLRQRLHSETLTRASRNAGRSFSVMKHTTRTIREASQCVYRRGRKFACTINTAVQEGIISKNPLRGIEGVKDGSPERVYLTLDELKRMIATPCRNKELRRAFLFSCLTGLRVSDIKKMTWKEVGQCGEFTRITFAQQKTKEQEYLDISKDAASLSAAILPISSLETCA